MAKNQNGLAESVQPDESGGWAGGFLADEDGFDRRALWRLGSWGAGSIGAVIIAFLAYNSGAGLRPQQTAVADLAKQSPQLEIAKAAEKEIRRLSVAIDTLNGDRDRLFARVAALEQEFESVTGSISQNARTRTEATMAAAPPTMEPDPAKKPDSVVNASTTTNASTEAPLSATVAFTMADAAAAVKPSVAPSPVDDSSKSGNVQPTPSTPITPGTGASAATATPVTPQAASQPAPAAHDPPATMPRERDKTAALETAELEAERNLHHHKEAQNVAASTPPIADAPQSPPLPPSPAIPAPHTDFGVDLGSAGSIKGLRALWQNLLQSEAKELTSLHPMIVLKETNNGSGTQMRLVAGPLADAAAAAKICAVLSENGRTCGTAVFEGQRLLAKGDSKGGDAAMTRKPKPTRVSRHRHSRKLTSVEAPAPSSPPPPPQPSTFGSIFSH
ncbi:SPOR domain-containing protein [Nitrobacter sp.]|uniref:SPOR domain-containing protein n=1 Tax=Nitrobacter sp. TaxID=29420 RepID=UPI001E191D2A|nr:SPOR domain-containing protein [Nitrobacter sp.]MCB1392178.1 SPOR domain-containing protein [Nitrobacter sp.]MCV0386702.1 SPOR domain-containing protein [Nitrobacter sp.]